MNEESAAQLLGKWPVEHQRQILNYLSNQIGDVDPEALLHDWSLRRRPSQATPQGDW